MPSYSARLLTEENWITVLGRVQVRDDGVGGQLCWPGNMVKIFRNIKMFITRMSLTIVIFLYNWPSLV